MLCHSCLTHPQRDVSCCHRKTLHPSCCAQGTNTHPRLYSHSAFPPSAVVMTEHLPHIPPLAASYVAGNSLFWPTSNPSSTKLKVQPALHTLHETMYLAAADEEVHTLRRCEQTFCCPFGQVLPTTPIRQETMYASLYRVPGVRQVTSVSCLKAEMTLQDPQHS